jgi:hypothetical protein
LFAQNLVAIKATRWLAWLNTGRFTLIWQRNIEPDSPGKLAFHLDAFVIRNRSRTLLQSMRCSLVRQGSMINMARAARWSIATSLSASQRLT